MWLDDQRGLKGGINDVAHPLWKEFDRVNLKGLGLDKLETYRSMLDCWESNDANFGEPNPRELPEGGKIPRCFFSMEFKKGYWVDSKKDCWGGATIELNYSLKNSDRVFPNFPKDSAEQTNRRTNWPQTQKIQSLTCN
jgi:hypothetical protein